MSNILEDLNLESKAYILATVHRAENTDNPARLIEIFEGLDEVAKDIPIILPVHPRTGKLLGNIKFSPSNLKIIPPLGYLDLVMLEKNARLIVTDSGGIQKEAFFHEVPCVTLRDEIEWVELIVAGVVNLFVGADKGKIIQCIGRMI